MIRPTLFMAIMGALSSGNDKLHGVFNRFSNRDSIKPTRSAAESAERIAAAELKRARRAEKRMAQCTKA